MNMAANFSILVKLGTCVDNLLLRIVLRAGVLAKLQLKYPRQFFIHLVRVNLHVLPFRNIPPSTNTQILLMNCASLRAPILTSKRPTPHQHTPYHKANMVFCNDKAYSSFWLTVYILLRYYSS